MTAQLFIWLSEIYAFISGAGNSRYTIAPEIWTPSEAGVYSTFSTMHARIGRIIIAIRA